MSKGSELMDIKQLIGETTDYDKKLALEEKKPKSWCKSISAFANCFGGKLIFGVSNDSELVGFADADPASTPSFSTLITSPSLTLYCLPPVAIIAYIWHLLIITRQFWCSVMKLIPNCAAYGYYDNSHFFNCQAFF